MKYTKLAAAALALAGLPALAHAQDAASVTLTEGAKVYGPQGNEVGTIEQVSGANVIVNTGKNSATLPASSFAKGEKGPMIGFTKEQLDAAIESASQKANAKLDAALVAGAAVRSMDGVPLGVVQGMGDDGTVKIERDGAAFALKRDMFATDANGLIVRANAADVNAALAKAPSATGSDSSTAAAGESSAASEESATAATESPGAEAAGESEPSPAEQGTGAPAQ